MPIKKRTTLPPPPPTRTRQSGSDPYKLPGRPIGELLREFDRKASDAAWVGDDEEAKRCQQIADGYRARLEAGELYEVDF